MPRGHTRTCRRRFTTSRSMVSCETKGPGPGSWRRRDLIDAVGVDGSRRLDGWDLDSPCDALGTILDVRLTLTRHRPGSIHRTCLGSTGADPFRAPSRDPASNLISGRGPSVLGLWSPTARGTDMKVREPSFPRNHRTLGTIMAVNDGSSTTDASLPQHLVVASRKPPYFVLLSSERGLNEN